MTCREYDGNILATQQVCFIFIVMFLFYQYLPQCDSVLHIQDGHVIGFDSHAKLFEDSVDYATLYKSHMDNIEKEDYER